MSGEARRAVEDVRALLAELVAIGASSLHVATSEVEVFITRRSEPNPMLARQPEPATDPRAVDRPEHTVTAPHVATVDWVAGVGVALGAGQPLARLRVLDRVEEVPCGAAAIVVQVNAAVGSLVEYGQGLVTIAETPE